MKTFTFDPAQFKERMDDIIERNKHSLTTADRMVLQGIPNNMKALADAYRKAVTQEALVYHADIRYTEGAGGDVMALQIPVATGWRIQDGMLVVSYVNPDNERHCSFLIPAEHIVSMGFVDNEEYSDAEEAGGSSRSSDPDASDETGGTGPGEGLGGETEGSGDRSEQDQSEPIPN